MEAAVSLFWIALVAVAAPLLSALVPAGWSRKPCCCWRSG
jgi:hypothetical protein